MTCLNENRHYIWVSNGTLGQCRILEFDVCFSSYPKEGTYPMTVTLHILW